MTRFTFISFVAIVMSFASAARAQDQEARRISAEARGHAEAGRHGLSAESYLALYEHMRGAGNPRAPVALWNAGVELEAAGRHRDARDTLQRFLDGSIELASDGTIAGYRSEALAKIADLDARLRTLSDESAGEGAAEEQHEENAEDRSNRAEPPATDSSISPVGPIVLGGGVLTLGVGAVFGGLALTRNAELRDRCGGTDCLDTPENRGTNDEMRAFATAADVLIVAGAAIVIAGLVLTFTLTESSEAPVRATAALTPWSATLRIEGSY